MIRLPHALAAWNTPGFREVLKQEIAGIDPQALPLQQGLALSSHVADRPFQPVVLDTREDDGQLQAKVGIFYAGIIAGCSCADDPTPIDEQTEYCVLQFEIDRATADTRVSLLEE
jgi:hypothetical protein